MAKVMKFKQTGFTIVELLIVVVVIGILAAITIVAYNGIKKRAVVSQTTSELSVLNKAIAAYRAVYGIYPETPGGNWLGINGEDNYIPGLMPEFISNLPQNPTSVVDAAYAYRSNGTDYKLISHIDNLCGEVRKIQPNLVDPARNCWAYGYWTSGYQSL